VFILSLLSFSLRKEFFSELGVRDPSHVLQQCSERESKVREEQERETVGRWRGKKSAETFPVWTGKETSFQFLLHYWEPLCCIPTASCFWE